MFTSTEMLELARATRQPQIDAATAHRQAKLARETLVTTSTQTPRHRIRFGWPLHVRPHGV